MKQFKFISALLMCLLTPVLPAFADNEIKYFVLWHIDGSSTALSLEEHPRIKVDAVNKTLLCTTSTLEISLNMVDVCRYSFEETADVTSVGETVATSGCLDKEGESLILSNHPAFGQAYVYTAGGFLKESYTLDGNGNLIIHTAGWEKGLYIIKIEKTTFKILIK
jgi:hypothetical protein